MKQHAWVQIIKGDGKALTPVIRNTEKGRSDYANRAYDKYDDEVTVIAYHFDEYLKVIIDCTWHA